VEVDILKNQLQVKREAPSLKVKCVKSPMKSPSIKVKKIRSDELVLKEKPIQSFSDEKIP